MTAVACSCVSMYAVSSVSLPSHQVLKPETYQARYENACRIEGFCVIEGSNKYGRKPMQICIGSTFLAGHPP